MQMKILARYPGGLSREQYIKELVSRYTESKNCWHFSIKQIEIPITAVVNHVFYIINETNDLQSKIDNINFIRKFVQNEISNPRKLRPYPHYRSLYYFQKGCKPPPRLALKRNNIPFPEEHEEAALYA